MGGIGYREKGNEAVAAQRHRRSPLVPGGNRALKPARPLQAMAGLGALPLRPPLPSRSQPSREPRSPGPGDGGACSLIQGGLSPRTSTSGHCPMSPCQAQVLGTNARPTHARHQEGERAWAAGSRGPTPDPCRALALLRSPRVPQKVQRSRSGGHEGLSSKATLRPQEASQARSGGGGHGREPASPCSVPGCGVWRNVPQQPGLPRC